MSCITSHNILKWHPLGLCLFFVWKKQKSSKCHDVANDVAPLWTPQKQVAKLKLKQKRNDCWKNLFSNFAESLELESLQLVFVFSIFSRLVSSQHPSSSSSTQKQKNVFSMKLNLNSLTLKMFFPSSVTSKKLPNVFKTCPKMISLGQWKILTLLQKLPEMWVVGVKNNCCYWLWKVSQSAINRLIWSHCFRALSQSHTKFQSKVWCQKSRDKF